MKLFSSKPTTNEDLLDTTLYTMPNSKDTISWADALEGTLVLGTTGSGKTSGSGKHIATAMLQGGFGMLVLCSKKKERASWEKLIKEVAPDRAKDVVVFNKGCKLTFNFLEYDMFREGQGAGDVLNAIESIMSLNEVNRAYLSGGGGSNEDRFWDLSLRRLCARSISTLRLAGEEISIINMRKLVSSSFKGEEADHYMKLERQADNEKIDQAKQQQAAEELDKMIESSYFLQVLFNISASSEEENEEVELLMNYWFKEFPKIGERANSIITESYMGIVEAFLNQGVLKSHFSSGLSPELLPENIYLQNKIVILDFPVKEIGVPALYAAMIYKTTFQAAMERRDVDTEKNPKPVGLFIDEVQQFISYRHDIQFQATARSSWVACTYLTQNLDGVVNVMGGQHALSKAKSFLGNLNLKIFGANGDFNTNQWASQMIGMHLVNHENVTINEEMKVSKSKNQHKEYKVMPSYYTTLKTGRKRNSYQVETVVFKPGRTWGKEKQNYALVSFDQRG